MAKTPAKKLGKSAAIMHTKRVFGAERMTFPDTPLPEFELGLVLSWYNNTKDLSQAKAYAVEYLKSIGDDRHIGISKTPEKMLRPTPCWVCRMITLGLVLSDSQRETFERLLNTSIRVKVDTSDEEEVSTPVVPIIQKRIVARTSDIIADVEDALDKWRTQPFSILSYLNENKASVTIVTGVIDYYKPLLEEIALAVSGKDKEVKEGYSHLTKMELNRYHRFVLAIFAELQKYVEVVNVPKVRKPRKKKEIPLDKKLALLQYLPTFLPNQVKSIPPANMIGAKEVWLFETVAKKLTVLRADGPNGLDINRTTLTGFDPKQSGAKRIGRSTGKHLDSILLGARTVCKKAFHAITSDPLEPTGRVNKNTIILKAFR